MVYLTYTKNKLFQLKLKSTLRILTMLCKAEHRIRINHNFYRFLLSSTSIFQNKMKNLEKYVIISNR